jgi:hypothetical protein
MGIPLEGTVDDARAGTDCKKYLQVQRYVSFYPLPTSAVLPYSRPAIDETMGWIHPWIKEADDRFSHSHDY